ncbi:hypothetical protein CEQ90_06340 [Lewinellaceae bacterium SD302]|nr:hypothetical protein CEQ90_06340 [Lewinellaceae bacterium SD302]
MSFEHAAIQSVKANRALQKRESLLFDRERMVNFNKPAIRAVRRLDDNGKAYRLATEPEIKQWFTISGIVTLLIAAGIVLASIWSNPIV